MRTMLFFFAALFLYSNAYGGTADSLKKPKVYHVNYPVVGVIIGGGMVADFLGVQRLRGRPDLTIAELRYLDTQKESFTAFDEWGLQQKASDRPFYNSLSTYTLDGFVLAPCLLLFNKEIRKDWGDLLLMYVEGHTLTLANYCYSFLGPTYVERYRPRAYYSDIPDITRQDGENRNSFYSGHVASAAYSSFFMAKVYCDYHPDLGAKKYLIYTAAVIPPLVMGYLRTKALDHFPSDNAIGLIIGTVIGIAVPELHKYPCNRNITLGMFTVPEGMGLSIGLKLQDKHLLASSKSKMKDK